LHGFGVIGRCRYPFICHCEILHSSFLSCCFSSSSQVSCINPKCVLQEPDSLVGIGSKTRSTVLHCTGQAFVWRRVRQPRMEKATCPPRDDKTIILLTRSFFFQQTSISTKAICSMARSPGTLSITLRLLVIFYTALAVAVSTQEPLLEKSSYKLGDAIPVTCLNRTV